MAGPGPARADIVYDAVRSAVRPQTDDETAVVTLLDARGTLMELKVRKLPRGRWRHAAPIERQCSHEGHTAHMHAAAQSHSRCRQTHQSLCVL